MSVNLLSGLSPDAKKLIIHKPVYICGKVTGTDDYSTRFMAAEIALKNLGFYSPMIYNPVIIIACEQADLNYLMPYAEIMNELQPWLMKAALLVRLSDWIDSPGAKLENQFAMDNHIMIADLVDGELMIAPEMLGVK